jgi:hypothetical protein
MALCCKNCAQEIAIDSAGRIPPWCSHCGADIQREPEESESRTGCAIAGGADKLKAPANRSQQAAPAREPAPSSEPMRFQLDWYEPAAFRRALQPCRPAFRWIRRFLFGFFAIIALGLAAIYGFGELFLEPLPLIISKTLGTGLFCLIALPLLIWAATRTLSFYITVGPHGVGRVRSIPLGHHAIVQRSEFPWKDIQELVYLEDCPLGGRSWRVVLVQSADGREELMGIANEVSPEQLAATAAAWGKRLERVSEPCLPR